MAAKDHAVSADEATASALTGELADLLYHSLVLMADAAGRAEAVIRTLAGTRRQVASSYSAAASMKCGSSPPHPA